MKKFFQMTDANEDTYVIVANDLEHAKDVIRKSGVEFGYPSKPFDQAVGLEWSEMTDDQVARRTRIHTEDERGTIPLKQCNIGEWFCNEF